MTKKNKISLIVGGLSLISIYYFFIFSKRVPNLSMINFNWGNRSIKAMFGNTPVIISEFNDGIFNSGRNYSNKYFLEIENKGRGRVMATIFKKQGEEKTPILKREVDFDSRLVRTIL